MFATLTAPSFGPVHARRMRGNTVLPCRPRRDAHARRCPHGRDISCPTRHRESDPRLGQPMCPDCYDYQAAVLFNAYAGDLWRRFITYLPRQLARRLGITQKQLRTLVRIRYVKVAEYQARGVVHFHAVIRLDSPEKDHQPPPPGIDAAALSDATGQSRFRAWAHMLGYGGHFLTKSRRYSVTFGQLRQARTDHRRAERHPGGEHDPWGGPLEENVVLITKAWTYAGTGYTGVAGDAVALAAAARARERQDHAA